MDRKKILLPVEKLKDSFVLNKKLHCTLYGFIVFEVDWRNVRGIQYVNELQTDTSLAIESKSMKRWEFESIEQASKFISSWYTGNYRECHLLQDYLDSLCVSGEVFVDAHEEFVSENQNFEDKGDYNFSDCKYSAPDFSNDVLTFVGSPCTPPCSGPYKRRKILRSSGGSFIDDDSMDTVSEIMSSPRLSVASPDLTSDGDNTNPLEARAYQDVFILFKFDNPHLPFKLKEVIMSDVRLLTLLEYGLPSWVIFLQSYPIFTQIYRPWMCPLARFLYVLISTITVLIGFYDLYKNVPILKAVASHLFGPLFDWIENWEMVSRIQCLGTMLFLHNFEKSVRWFLAITRAANSVFNALLKPFAGPVAELAVIFTPIWDATASIVVVVTSGVYFGFISLVNLIAEILQFAVWPFWLILSTLWNIVTFVIYPTILLLWQVFSAPARMVLALTNLIWTVMLNIYCLMGECWSSICIVFQFSSMSTATVGAHEASLLQSLWNVLFSRIFRAVRSILFGFVAFFTACNRHRLRSLEFVYMHLRSSKIS